MLAAADVDTARVVKAAPDRAEPIDSALPWLAEVAEAAPWLSACTPPMDWDAVRPAAWPVVDVASDDDVADDWVDSTALAKLYARALPMVVLALALLAITERCCAWARPMLPATALYSEVRALTSCVGGGRQWWQQV